MIFTGPIFIHGYRRPMAERAKARKVCGPYQWTPSKPGMGRGFYQASNGLRMDTAGSSFALRLDYANTHLAYSGRRPTAYWTDEHGCSGKLTPIVALLPHGRGFLAGWTMGEGMCASLDNTIWPTIEEAARAAHDEAESAAEAQREYEEEERARLDAEEREEESYDHD